LNLVKALPHFAHRFAGGIALFSGALCSVLAIGRNHWAKARWVEGIALREMIGIERTGKSFPK